MKKDDLIDSMGRIDDDLVEHVDALRRKKKKSRRGIVAAAAAACLVLAVAAAVVIANPWPHEGQPQSADAQEGQENQENPSGSGQQPGTDVQPGSFPADSTARLQLLDFSAAEEYTPVTPSVQPYSVSAGLTNVINLDQFYDYYYLSDEKLQLLEQNLFVVSDSYYHEFFQAYEYNRYAQIPNYVTVDSLMHTYHLYFSLLLNRTEKNYLADELLALSKAMLETSMGQYELLVGTQWEAAARRNVAYFAVAASLQDPAQEVPSYAAQLVRQELDLVYAAGGIDISPLAENEMDYSQYKPRGYYEGDEILERYFRAMMWYGQVNFAQDNDSLTRSALLMTLAMAQTDMTAWEKIYTVTSFFAGVSDDLGYYEYAPAIAEAYGGYPTVEALKSDEGAYARFVELAAEMAPPAINSVPVYADEEGDLGEMNKGFRFMGQRFTIDAAIMQKLVYRAVGENGDGSLRLLPDTLDVPAALGSDLALQLLEEQGETEYSGYSENMVRLREIVENAPESAWTSSLYSSWLYTLEPLLETKGEGYPSFMTSTEWQKKDLETFAGSFTELKHDTVLYAKQVMAEMGGGPEETDDRGYVEPEPEVYRRFMLLAQQTAEGLERFGLIDSGDVENLGRLEELARRLMIISNKELQDETLTDEEYDLIRDYGGTLEHFWTEAVRDRTDAEYLAPQEIPASLVTDIATDPNGRVLQVATGKPAEILVIVPVDGKLRIAAGTVYSFYQFEQPIGERLTDTEWRQMIGEWIGEDGMYDFGNRIEKPWWTQSYWSRE
ncbi:MAG: DUF3160 domain-containing protein [Oscillospiraceae bacterium]